jgi:hypothetical protein
MQLRQQIKKAELQYQQPIMHQIPYPCLQSLQPQNEPVLSHIPAKSAHNSPAENYITINTRSLMNYQAIIS